MTLTFILILFGLFSCVVLAIIFYLIYRFPKISLASIIALVCVLFFSYKYLERQHHLSFVPTQFGVTKIIYVNEESWGFGPGGNESGVIVYELPDKIADRLNKDGLMYLHSLSEDVRHGDDPHSLYHDWKETPLDSFEGWVEQDVNPNDSAKNKPRLQAFLDHYGFGVAVAQEFADAVDKAITTQGIFYAYGRTGILLINPRSKRVVFAYIG